MSAFLSATSNQSLRTAWKSRRDRLRKSCFGIDRISGQAFERSLDREMRELRHRISSKFKPHDLLALVKPKPNGEARIICVPTIADRILQFSLLNELRPRLGAMGLDNPVSFGLVQGRARSVLGARSFACNARSERPWTYRTDIQKFFDNINRDALQESLRKVVRKATLLPILDAFIHTEIGDGLDPKWKSIVAQAGIRKGLGVRQGMPLSPLFAGAYLRDLDRYLVRQGGLTARYVDDIVSFFATEAEAETFHWMLKEELAKLELTIGDPGAPNSKTAIYAPNEPAEFLGMELARTSSGIYHLRIGRRTVDKVVQGIADACSLSVLLDRQVSLTTMGTYFNGVQAGYLNAYAEAHNRDELRDAMSSASQKAQRKVLESLFGVQGLANIGHIEMKFLGIENTN